MSDELSVWIFFPNAAGSECVGQALGAREAVEMAKDYSERPAALAGFITRIIITDGGDHTVFEWCHGEGVTYPPADAKNG
jgi:hypothetical protein